MQEQPTIVTSWDSMPPEVYAEGEVYSTRVLADRYRKMERGLEFIKQHMEIVTPDLDHSSIYSMVKKALEK